MVVLSCLVVDIVPKVSMYRDISIERSIHRIELFDILYTAVPKYRTLPMVVVVSCLVSDIVPKVAIQYVPKHQTSKLSKGSIYTEMSKIELSIYCIESFDIAKKH